MYPDDGPEGVDGVFGGLFSFVIVTALELDHPDEAPLLSVALTLT